MFIFNILLESIDPIKGVGQLTNSTVSLAEAAFNFGALKVIFGAFMVVVLCLFLMLAYYVVVIGKKVNTVHDKAIAIDAFIHNSANSTIGRSEALIVLRRAISTMGLFFKYSIIKIKVANNIHEREIVKNKVEKLVTNHWQELTGYLSVFMYNGEPLSHLLDSEDVEGLIEMVISCIYDKKEPFDLYSTSSQVNLYIDALKINYTRKIN